MALLRVVVFCGSAVVRMIVRRVVMSVNMRHAVMIVGQAMGRDRAVGERQCDRRRDDTQGIDRGGDRHRPKPPLSGQPKCHIIYWSIPARADHVATAL